MGETFYRVPYPIAPYGTEPMVHLHSAVQIHGYKVKTTLSSRMYTVTALDRYSICGKNGKNLVTMKQAVVCYLVLRKITLAASNVCINQLNESCQSI